MYSKAIEFTPGTEVYVQNFGLGSPWLAGMVLERRGPISYLVKLSDGRCFRRHVDHLRLRLAEATPTQEWDTQPWFEGSLTEARGSLPASNSARQSPEIPPPLRRSSRVSHPPDRYGVTVSH